MALTLGQVAAVATPARIGATHGGLPRRPCHRRATGGGCACVEMIISRSSRSIGTPCGDLNVVPIHSQQRARDVVQHATDTMLRAAGSVSDNHDEQHAA